VDHIGQRHFALDHPEAVRASAEMQHVEATYQSLLALLSIRLEKPGPKFRDSNYNQPSPMADTESATTKQPHFESMVGVSFYSG
jgi:hypothetical protein